MIISQIIIKLSFNIINFFQYLNQNSIDLKYFNNKFNINNNGEKSFKTL